MNLGFMLSRHWFCKIEADQLANSIQREHQAELEAQIN
jgi:hypothetical protein